MCYNTMKYYQLEKHTKYLSIIQHRSTLKSLLREKTGIKGQYILYSLHRVHANSREKANCCFVEDRRMRLMTKGGCKTQSK